MKVQILAVGKVKGPFAQSVAEYEKRAARYWKLGVEEISSGARGTSANPELVLKTEATRLLARISKELEVVALTRSGMTMDSRELAKYLEHRALTASAGVAFYNWWRVWPWRRSSRSSPAKTIVITHDLATPACSARLERATLPRRDNSTWRTISQRIAGSCSYRS